RVAPAAAPRYLPAGPPAALGGPIDIEIGLLQDGDQRTPLPASGAVVFVGQRMYLRIHNRGQQAVYVSAFGIGVAGHIELLTRASPTGVPIGPNAEHMLGDPADHGTEILLRWPAHP